MRVPRMLSLDLGSDPIMLPEKHKCITFSFLKKKRKTFTDGTLDNWLSYKMDGGRERWRERWREDGAMEGEVEGGESDGGRGGGRRERWRTLAHHYGRRETEMNEGRKTVRERENLSGV